MDFIFWEPRIFSYPHIEISRVKHYAMEKNNIKYKSEPEKACCRAWAIHFTLFEEIQVLHPKKCFQVGNYQNVNYACRDEVSIKGVHLPALRVIFFFVRPRKREPRMNHTKNCNGNSKDHVDVNDKYWFVYLSYVNIVWLF
jgi:hypothetical protein